MKQDQSRRRELKKQALLIYEQDKIKHFEWWLDNIYLQKKSKKIIYDHKGKKTDKHRRILNKDIKNIRDKLYEFAIYPNDYVYARIVFDLLEEFTPLKKKLKKYKIKSIHKDFGKSGFNQFELVYFMHHINKILDLIIPKKPLRYARQ